MSAGLPSHTHTVTMNRTRKSGTDTPYIWSQVENQNGEDSVTSSEPDNEIYGNSETVTPESLSCLVCIKYE